MKKQFILFFVFIPTFLFADIEGTTKILMGPEGIQYEINSDVDASTWDFVIRGINLAKSTIELIGDLASQNYGRAIYNGLSTFNNAIKFGEEFEDKVAVEVRVIRVNKEDGPYILKMIFNGTSGTDLTDDTIEWVRIGAPIDREHFEITNNGSGQGTINVGAEIIIKNIQSLQPGVYPIIFSMKEEDCTSCLGIVHIIKIIVEGEVCSQQLSPQCNSTVEEITNVKQSLTLEEAGLHNFLINNQATIDNQYRNFRQMVFNNCRSRCESSSNSTDCFDCLDEVDDIFQWCIPLNSNAIRKSGQTQVAIKSSSQLCTEYRRRVNRINALNLTYNGLLIDFNQNNCSPCNPFPLNIKASQSNFGKDIRVTWDNVNKYYSECGYKVYRASTIFGPRELIDNNIRESNSLTKKQVESNNDKDENYFYWVGSVRRGDGIWRTCEDSRKLNENISINEVAVGWSSPCRFTTRTQNDFNFNNSDRQKVLFRTITYDTNCEWGIDLYQNYPWIENFIEDNPAIDSKYVILNRNPYSETRSANLNIFHRRSEWSWDNIIQSIQINQVGLLCRYDVEYDETIKQLGGYGRIDISCQDNCGWLLKSETEWITIETVSSGTGYTSFHVKPNISPNKRIGTIKLSYSQEGEIRGSRILKVSQKGKVIN